MSSAPQVAIPEPAQAPAALAAVQPERAPGAAKRASGAAMPARAPAAALARDVAARLGNEWLPRLAWMISSTGRPGLCGLALLLAAALFYFSTHLPISADVEAMRAELAATQEQPGSPGAVKQAGAAVAVHALPPRSDLPAILRQLFSQATQARLAIDTGKYELTATASGGIVRYQVAFPVVGPYPQMRAFIDSTLQAMPAVALSDLVLDRRSIADADVEAEVRMTVYTVAASGLGPVNVRSAAHESARAVAATQAASLFAPHSWFVAPPPPPPAAPPPPPEPTAPPFPYSVLGSFAPEGQPRVYFLAHGDSVIDVRVGDRLEGVYQFESEGNGQLVFVYLPLELRQTVAAVVAP